jgi:deoxyribodipyrimidine photo-lyase
MPPRVNICWFRRDLRLHDNAALYHALKDKNPVVALFIFDTDILDELEDKEDRRVEFIHGALYKMQEELVKKGSTLDVRVGVPSAVFQQVLKDYKVEKIFFNHDYEPYARKRDEGIGEQCREAGVSFHHYKDQVLLDKGEVLKDDGSPYTIFTPYYRTWRSVLTDFHLRSYPTEKYFDHFYRQAPKTVPSLEEIGFRSSAQSFPSSQWERGVIQHYDKQRDIPSIHGTSRLSVHLRFGTISIRDLAREAGALNETFFKELAWREFYQMILWHFPRVVGHSFRPEYDKIEWRNNEKEFEAWCQGMTGYPIVDAGMRELNSTGFMHNRVRMIVASFLTKHLLIDWRWGEAYFARKLLDYDLASNNGGWQWAAGTGCDAAPYFRVFNPYLQTKKFDPELKYVRQWVPELEELNYPNPIVDHEVARKRALAAYAKALKK